MFRYDLALKHYTIALAISSLQDDALYVDRKALLFNGFVCWFGMITFKTKVRYQQ